ncbi:MAG: PQQ-binding-like beta-propeller repeat protein [Myxococcota bacterium]
MSQSVKIIVGHTWQDDVRYLNELRGVRTLESGVDLSEIRDIIDIVVGGDNITSYVAEESIFGVLTSLLGAVARLLRGHSQKAIVEFDCEPWELVLYPDSTTDGLRVSVYSIDRRNQVMAHDLLMETDEFVEALVEASEALLTDLYGISDAFSSQDIIREFSANLEAVKQLDAPRMASRPERHRSGVGLRQGGSSGASGLTISYTFDADHEALQRYRGENQFDLHAILVPGDVAIEFQGREMSIAGDYPALTVRALIRRARALLNHIETSDADDFRSDSELWHTRFDVVAERGRWEVIAGPPGGDQTLRCQVSPADGIDAILSIAELFCSELLSLNPAMELNYRFTDLFEEVRELRSWYEDISGSNSYLDEPERYIQQSGDLRPAPSPGAPTPRFPWPFSRVHSIFPQRAWSFDSRQIHMFAATPAEAGLLVPTNSALHCLSWSTGESLWNFGESRGIRPASYAVAGEHLLIAEDGEGIRFLETETGEVVFENRSLRVSSWRLLVGAFAYPSESLVVAADLQGRILGLSADDGEIRWHFSSGHGRFVGVSGDGPLISALTGEGFLYTLNPVDGEVLWNVRLGGLSETPPAIHQGRLYTFSHDSMSQQLNIHCIQPFTGRSAWQHRIEGRLAGRPSFRDRWLILPVQRKNSFCVVGVDCEAGRPGSEWEVDVHSAGVSDIAEAEFATIDGEIHGIIKTDRGQVTCFRLEDGEVRWRAVDKDETWMLGGNRSLQTIGDCVLVPNHQLELRDLDDGSLRHVIEQPVRSPEFVHAAGSLNIVVGSKQGKKDDPDILYGYRLDHFLSVVE